MAKWGEGDPRWIVEERPDSTNVNNWHWTEKNCFSWAEQYIKDTFPGKSVTADGTVVEMTAVKEVTGDVTVTNRKGRVKTFYDLTLSFKWKATKDGKEATGTLHIEDVNQEDEPDDVHHKITTDNESDESKALKGSVKQFIPLILSILNEKMLADLRSQFEQKVLLPTKNDSTKNGQAPKQPAAVTNPPATTTAPPAAAAAPAPSHPAAPKKGGAKIDLTVELLASAADVYAALVNPQRVSIWTQAPAIIAPTPNTAFSLYNGNVTGHVIEVETNARVVQSWRVSTWPQDVYSRVTFTITQNESSTNVRMQQEGIPSDLKEATEQNWHRMIFDRIKAIFGWGGPSFM